jgi:hypothetical protein
LCFFQSAFWHATLILVIVLDGSFSIVCIWYIRAITVRNGEILDGFLGFRV